MKSLIIVALSLSLFACVGSDIEPLHQGMYKAHCNKRERYCARQMTQICHQGFLFLNEDGSIFMCIESVDDAWK